MIKAGFIMKFPDLVKKVVFSTCAINTALILIITAFAGSVPSLQAGPFKLSTVLLILLFSFLAGVINLVFCLKKPGLFAKIAIHFVLLTLLIFLFMVIVGGFAGGSGSRSSVILFTLLIYTVIYAVIAAIAAAISKKSKKRRDETTKEYESQF